MLQTQDAFALLRPVSFDKTYVPSVSSNSYCS